MNNGYAYSLYDMSLKNDNLDNIFLEFKTFYNLFAENKDLDDYLSSLVISNDEKKKIIDKIVGKNSVDFRYFLYVVSDNDEFKHLSEIYEDFKEAYYEYAHIKEVVVLSNQKLNENEHKKIQKLMDKKYPDYEILLIEKIDKDILVGFKIFVDNVELGANLQQEINDLKINF